MTKRVLDLDLDFFVHGVAHWRSRDDGRLNATDFPAWSVDEARAFLTDQCGLEARLPGIVVEYHADLFVEWRNAIEANQLPSQFSVTHVDAHADLGLGDSGYRYLMAEVLFREVAERTDPEQYPTKLADGNFLAFAIACRWISALEYVYNRGGGSDLLYFHMEDFDLQADNIELKAVTVEELKQAVIGGMRPRVSHREPLVPIRQVRWDEFAGEEPFDVICLARSPNFTPEEADRVFDMIRTEFIDEGAWE